MLEEAGVLQKKALSSKPRDIQAISKSIDETTKSVLENGRATRQGETSITQPSGEPANLTLPASARTAAGVPNISRATPAAPPIAPAAPPIVLAAPSIAPAAPPIAPAAPPIAPAAPPIAPAAPPIAPGPPSIAPVAPPLAPAARSGAVPPSAPAIPKYDPSAPGSASTNSNSSFASPPSESAAPKITEKKVPVDGNECNFCHFFNPKKAKFCQSCTKKLGDKPAAPTSSKPSSSQSSSSSPSKPSSEDENLPPYKCLKCGFENPGKAKFCQSCSTRRGEDGSSHSKVTTKIVPTAKPKLLISKKKPNQKSTNEKDTSEVDKTWTCPCGFVSPSSSRFCQSCAKAKP